MHPSFLRTLRSLDSERRGASPWSAAFAVFLLGSWLAWAVLARVAVVEVSERARIEVESPPLPLAVPVAGRLTAFRLALHQRVERGEVLAELDQGIERQRLREEQARLASFDVELLTLRREVAALTSAQAAEQQVARLTGKLARARTEEAVRRNEHAEEVAGRYRKMEGAAAELEIRRTLAEAAQGQAALASQRAEEARQRGEKWALQLNARVRLQEMEHQQAILSGRRATSAATLATIEAEIERRILRAPVSGYIDAVAPLAPGAFLQAGDSLGVLLPVAPLRVVAFYQPSAALGHVASGQQAWMRLAGFPYTQYGRLPMRVSRCASEVREGLVRVELTIDSNTPFAVLLQHGLPGTVDIDVESVSPLRLVLRTLGRIGTRRDNDAAAGRGR